MAGAESSGNALLRNRQCSCADWSRTCLVASDVLRAVGSHEVSTRTGRVEPRTVKSRLTPHVGLTEPRKYARNRLLWGD